jgi:predicted transcriptional regulator
MEKQTEIQLAKGIDKKLDVIERHLQVLEIVQKKEPIGIFKIAELTKIPNTLVRNSLRALEFKKMIEPTRKGAVTTNKVSEVLDNLKTQLKDINNRTSKIIKRLK